MNQDWVHGILRIGTLQKELNHARSDCDTFLKGDIRFTRAGKVDIHKVFSRYGEDDDEDKGLKVSPIVFHLKCEVKGSASEFLGISALCDFIDSLVDLKGIEAWTDEVCDRSEDSQDHLISKTFLNRAKGRVFDAFICERMKVAERIDHTRTFEMSTLLRSTRAQIYAINHESAMSTNVLVGRKTSAASQPGYEIYSWMVPPMPDRPWDLMLCYDEFRPGDLLKYDKAFNVEQLGTSWMVPIAVRSARINKVLGVWSHMLRRIFHVLLLADDLAHECACATQGMLAAEPSTATVGVTVVYHERTYVISVLGLRHSHRL